MLRSFYEREDTSLKINLMKAKNRPDKEQGTRCRRHTTAMGYYDFAKQGGVNPRPLPRRPFVTSLSAR